MKNTPLVDSDERIITLTDSNFQKSIASKTILVDFWAPWCGPCRIVAPTLNELARELPDDLYIGKVNVDENRSLAQKFGIRGIPTFIVFKNGKEINRFSGVKTKSFFLNQLKKA
jgi:thioredoxin 1